MDTYSLRATMELVYDEDSPTRFQPSLSEEYLDDLNRLFDRICQSYADREEIIAEKIHDVEDNLPDRVPSYDQEKIEAYTEQIKYLATLEALLDLVEIGYYIEKDPSIEGKPPVKIYPPDPERFEDDPKKYKKYEREILQKERQAQFEEQSVREFIREMENPDRHNGKNVDVTTLVADGQSLYEDFAPLQDAEREEIIDELDDLVDPYIQVAEKGETDPHTGLDLHDIWRYFRYTWLTPYNTVPGRNINLLIRDAARENHPVMGIASLASSMMNLKQRDQHIGWRIDAVEQELERKKRVNEVEHQLPKEERTPEQQTVTREVTNYLESEEEWQERVDDFCSMLRTAIRDAIQESIDNTRYDDFIDRYPDLTEEDFEKATETAFDRLEQLEGLGNYVFKNKPPLVDEVENPDEHENVFDPDEYGLSPEDLTDLDIEDTNPDHLDSWRAKSETALFVKKRARTLQKLLRDREYFQEHADEGDRRFIENALDSERGTRALQTALKEMKKRRVGAGMMNIQVCGAIPPYNNILGGKLVAMAITGPEAIEAYREKYEGYKSKIASAMKGAPVIKNNELVFLDTTGLFKVGSAQYDRVRVPAPNGQIEYEEIGMTEGYGSVQFGASTRERLTEVTELLENRRAVKNRFGEGIAPKMRKIRHGLENLGLDGELIKHESPRVIYAVDLAADFREYLFGLTDDPDYYWALEDVETEQESIYEHWRRRWVSKRIQRDEVLTRLQQFNAEEDILLGPEIRYQNHSLFDFY